MIVIEKPVLPDYTPTVETTLSWLGQFSADEIARIMVNANIKGLQMCADSCVIAEYLTRICKVPVTVKSYGALVGPPEEGHARPCLRHPTSVRLFIRRFDGGSYPELIWP